jgi:hypothetical protein
MRRMVIAIGCLLALASPDATPLAAQEIVDGIAARVENEIILLSDVRALSRYQQLVDGKAESDQQILDRLVDQWIVRNEADTAQFPHPSDEDVTRGVDRVRQSFPSIAEYDARKKLIGLSDDDVKRMVAAQLYLGNYLDSRFRPSAKIEPKDVEDFYEKEVLPRAKARGQAPPSLDAARDYIREALVQKSINDQAERWLNESRGRVHVDKMLQTGAS